MTARTFVVGTRGSRLALRQTEIALEALRRIHPGTAFDVREIKTAGDRTSASLSEIGGRGVFVIEIERELLAGGIDIAVHSLKDLPSQETAGVTIAAVLGREDARDALVSRGGLALGDLPAGARVGTGSPRREAQIVALRPDLVVADIRGNVDTRVRKVEEGEYDAVVLAAAGLARLGWLARAAQVFDPGQMLPAVGQGALAVQVRADDPETLALVREADDTETRVAVTAERAFERRLGGGCHAAIAAYAVILSAAHAVTSSRRNLGEEMGGTTPGRGHSGGAGQPVLHLRGLVGAADGTLVRGEIDGEASGAERLGVDLAERLLAQGASALLEAAV